MPEIRGGEVEKHLSCQAKKEVKEKSNLGRKTTAFAVLRIFFEPRCGQKSPHKVKFAT